MNTSIIPGSIKSIAQQSSKSIAEIFMNVDAIILIDCSGSMDTHDSGNLTRYERACQELKALQANMPGKIAVIGFSDKAEFMPGGIPSFLGGGTAMDKALQFVKVADNIPGMKFILISDGEPDSPEITLNIARSYKNKIDVIYIGDERRPTGRDFLNSLAQLTGGQSVTSDRAVNLQSGVMKLLVAG